MNDLSGFTGDGYDKGRNKLWQASWLVIQGLLLRHWWCPAALRVVVLRFFGADIGHGVLVRHRVRIHWPWKLSLGANVWIGEDVWILNLEPVSIGDNTCISQSVLLCTGSHDYSSETFEFDNAPIRIGSKCWIAARAIILRGVTIGDGAVVGANALVTQDVSAKDILLAPRAASFSPQHSGK